jgi:uncharacterized membrane protein (UPF0182 family)
MTPENSSLTELQHIKQMMERSTRFSSLSGFSGIAAGVCSLVGLWLAVNTIKTWENTGGRYAAIPTDQLVLKLLLIAIGTLVAAAVFSFIFVYLRCRKLGIPVFGLSARRVTYNMAIPIFMGGLFILRLATVGSYELMTSASLIFYGLALINASKYTFQEIRTLGFIELGIGLINLWFLQYGLVLWAIGFGVMHIIYGSLIWWRYERKELTQLPTAAHE